MKVIDGVKYYRISEVCKMVERSQTTISRVWYGAAEYAKENNIHFPFVLPKFRNDLDQKRTRYWSEEGVTKLIKFRDSLMPGDLAFYNRQHMWGERQQIAKERKEFKQAMEEAVDTDLNDLMKEKF